MENTIEMFKEVLHQGMINNFKNDGYLTPIIFFLKDGRPIITEIPDDYLNSDYGKELLGYLIKKICQQPNVLAAGLIIEAYGAKLDDKDENKNKILSGEIKVSELEDKQNIIFMLFSTPQSEEIIAYTVNNENKTIGNRFADGEANGFSGTFSNFFKWNQN